MTPVQPLVSLPQPGRMNRCVRLFRGQHKNIDEVLSPRIDEHRNVSAAQNVQTSANQGKTVLRKVFHRRREVQDRKSTRLNSSHVATSYAVFCLKEKSLRR